jgi:hypothetical protein
METARKNSALPEIEDRPGHRHGISWMALDSARLPELRKGAYRALEAKKR